MLSEAVNTFVNTVFMIAINLGCVVVPTLHSAVPAGHQGGLLLHRALRHARPVRAGQLRVLRQAHRQDPQSGGGDYGYLSKCLMGE